MQFEGICAYITTDLQEEVLSLSTDTALAILQVIRRVWRE